MRGGVWGCDSRATKEWQKGGREERKGGLTEAEERISVELACRIARISRTDTGGGGSASPCPLNGLMIFFLLPFTLIEFFFFFFRRIEILKSRRGTRWRRCFFFYREQLFPTANTVPKSRRNI